MQNRCGLPTQMIAPEEARALVPELASERYVAACYNPTDGIVFPWPFLWGYAHAAAKQGVVIHASTPVTAIERRGGRGRAGFRITTPAGAFDAERITAEAHFKGMTYVATLPLEEAKYRVGKAHGLARAAALWRRVSSVSQVRSTSASGSTCVGTTAPTPASAIS